MKPVDYIKFENKSLRKVSNTYARFSWFIKSFKPINKKRVGYLVKKRVMPPYEFTADEICHILIVKMSYVCTLRCILWFTIKLQPLLQSSVLSLNWFNISYHKLDVDFKTTIFSQNAENRHHITRFCEFWVPFVLHITSTVLNAKSCCIYRVATRSDFTLSYWDNVKSVLFVATRCMIPRNTSLIHNVIKQGASERIAVESCINASVNLSTIGSDNGLSSARRRAIN